MADFEEQLESLIDRMKEGNINKSECEVWMNDVQIFYNKFLTKHPLAQRIDTLLFQRHCKSLIHCLII